MARVRSFARIEGDSAARPIGMGGRTVCWENGRYRMNVTFTCSRRAGDGGSCTRGGVPT
jgi:hypothetical protein